ncbi:MAG: hypothetical protein H6740_26170 [Alphaproteobacteria bacterium]|nr:hypothetical protein [Alphaproteobacteria bacterium]
MLLMKRLGLLAALLGLATGLMACEEKKSNKIVLGAKSVPCDLTLETLPGTEWVIEKVNPDKSVEADIATRLKIDKEGDEIKAKYNVGSLSDMYDYDCKVEGERLFCFEPPRLADWCKALLVVEGGTCTAEKLKEWAPYATDEEIAKGIKEAEESVAKFRDTDNWKQYVFNNNNLGNKLQGLLYIRINERKCNLMITDNYMTIFNGERKEDSNPTGTNAFVKNDQGELLWEHCTDSGDLYPRKTAEHPTKEEEIQACYPTQGCGFTAEEDAWFAYLGQDGLEAKDGCTYSFDVWHNGKPQQKDVAAEIVDNKGKKEVRRAFSMKFSEPGQHVVTMVRYATCEGKKELEEVSCSLSVSQ